MRNIHYLVFSGGGAAGIAFAGAFKQLSQEPDFSFNKIKGIAGTSIGAVAALITALNYSPEEAEKKILAMDLKSFTDSDAYLQQTYRLFTKYGKFKGQTLFEFIKNILKEKTGRTDPENITFADLKKMGFKDLYIVTTKIYKENDVPTGKQKIFSYEKTPHTSVAVAILASCAAPIYFMRVRLKKIAKGTYVLDDSGHLFNDGGILNNFAIDFFDKPHFMNLPKDPNMKIVNPHTLGLALRKTEQINDPWHKPIKSILYDAHPFQYFKAVLNSLMFQKHKNNLDIEANRDRTIQIDRLGVKLNDFNITEKKKLELIESGKLAVHHYFAEINAKKAAISNVITLMEKKMAI